MDMKARRQTLRRHGETPVVVMPKQTHDEIERRQQIREELHDSRAVVVRSPRRKKP